MKPWAAVAALSFLVSCSSGFHAQGKVVFWSPRPDFSVAELAAKMPGVTVAEAPRQPWKTLVSSSDAPDLLVLEAGADAEEARAAGQLANLAPYVSRLSSAKSWWSSLGLPKADAPLTVLPSSVYLWGLFYNPKTLKRAGIEPPRTWAALVDSLGKLKAGGVTPIAVGASFGWPGLAWVSALDLRLNGADAHKALLAGTRPFDDVEMLRVYSTLVEWKAKGWFDAKAASKNWPEALADVSSGRAGFVLLGAFGLSRAGNPEELAFLPLPDQPGVLQGDLVSIQGFAVAGRSKSIETALRLADAAILAGASGQAEAYRSPAVAVGTADTEFQKWQRDRLAKDRYAAPLMDQALPRARAQAAQQAVIQFFSEGSRQTPAELALQFSTPLMGRAP